jgi:hypothetical protein
MHHKLIFTIGLFISICQPITGQTLGSVSHGSTLVSLDTANVSLRLDSVFALKPGRYNPSLLIRCTNDLLPLGKDSSIAAIKSAFERGNSDAEGYGLFLLLRIVFELPPAMDDPEMHFGKTDINPSESKSQVNRFPLLIVNSIPFLVVQRTFMTGVGESLDKHLSFYREFGQFRTTPLHFDTDLSKVELFELVKAEWRNVYPTIEFSTIQAEMEQQIRYLYE